MTRAKYSIPPPATPTQIRDYWRSLILTTACSDCALLEWLEPRETDLRKLNPSSLYEPVVRKCAALLNNCCTAEASGESRQRITARMTAELWNFLRLLAPSKRCPVANSTADLFQPHEDTTWPTANP